MRPDDLRESILISGSIRPFVEAEVEAFPGVSRRQWKNGVAGERPKDGNEHTSRRISFRKP
jgi:hypothetical protein